MKRILGVLYVTLAVWVGWPLLLVIGALAGWLVGTEPPGERVDGDWPWTEL